MILKNLEVSHLNAELILMMKARWYVWKPKFYGVIMAISLNWDISGHLLRGPSLFFFSLSPDREYCYQVTEPSSYTSQGS